MTSLRRFSLTIVVIALAIAAPAAQQDNARALENAEALLAKADPAGALPLFEQALAAARAANNDAETARAFFGLGRVAQRQRRNADARARYLEALAVYDRLADQRGIAVTADLIGRLAFSEIEISGPMFERAVTAAHLLGDADLEGSILHTHGDALFGAGQYEQALPYLIKAAAVFESAKLTDDLGTVYNSIGRLYRAHGRLDEALRYQKSALAVHRKSGDSMFLVQSLNAVSSVYQRLDDPAAARTYLEEALAVAARIPGGAGGRAEDFLRANMAAVLADLGELAPAATAFEQVIASNRDDFPALRRQQLAAIYVLLGRGADALKAADEAVSMCGTAKETCIGALIERSNAKALLGDRDGALADLSLTLQGIEEQRARLVPSDFFKQDYSRYYRRFYAAAIARQLDAGQDREALQTAELARSRAFLDLLASRDISLSTPGTALPLTMRSANPKLASPAQVAPANVDELTATAARLRSTLLVYWVNDNKMVIWVITPDRHVVSRQVDVTRAKLTSLVQDTAPFTGEQDAARPVVLRQSATAWRELYALLIKPVQPLLPAAKGSLLTIVPDDALLHLSFAALQDARGRYLLEDYALHYAPAGGLFQFTAAQRRAQSRSGPLLIVADPDAARRSTLDPVLPRLPGARNEAAAIARQMPPSRVLSLSAVAATEAAVREQAPSRAVLHFAAHASVSDADPFASYLALTRSGNATAADGVLTAQEIYGMKLSADLVVLSACRSASATVGGDGVATFARAFLYSGAASLIASVWDVADEPSDGLLPHFYRAWRGGATKAAALREAQLRRLAELRAGKVRVTTPLGPVVIPEHPVFWAGFVLFGEAD